MIERNHKQLPLTVQCQLLGLSRSGWYYRPVAVSPAGQVAVLDWYSRYVLSWELDQTLEVPFVLEAMGQALQTATPQICNSDQGSQFTSP